MKKIFFALMALTLFMNIHSSTLDKPKLKELYSELDFKFIEHIVKKNNEVVINKSNKLSKLVKKMIVSNDLYKILENFCIEKQLTKKENKCLIKYLSKKGYKFKRHENKTFIFVSTKSFYTKLVKYKLSKFKTKTKENFIYSAKWAVLKIKENPKTFVAFLASATVGTILGTTNISQLIISNLRELSNYISNFFTSSTTALQETQTLQKISPIYYNLEKEVESFYQGLPLLEQQLYNPDYNVSI